MRRGFVVLVITLAAAAALVIVGAAQARPKRLYYVSLGDSWAVGEQPAAGHKNDPATTHGFTDFLYRKLRNKHPGLILVKLGCGDATTKSMMDGSRRCLGNRPPYANKSAATSQLSYAIRFLRRHRGQIAFVTLIIGGNDVAPCANQPNNAAILACVANGINQIKANLPVIARRLRQAAGRKPVIVGSTYPDVVLGQWVKSANGKLLAQASVQIFRDQLSPALKSIYRRRRIGFVDATSGFGAYIPFSTTTHTRQYGTIPKAVANICRLAWYCVPRPQGPDIHLRTRGYRKLAGLFAHVIRTRPRG